MLSKNILAVLLLTYLADTTIGSPYNRRRDSSVRRGLASNVRSAWPTGNNEDNEKPEESPNEYNIIYEARMARRGSNPHSSVHTRTHSRMTPPYSNADAKSAFSLPSDNHGFQRKSPFSPDRVVKNPLTNSWRRGAVNTANIRKASSSSNDEPEYVY